MALTDTSTLLDCGRDIDAVWSGIGRPPNEHERTCSSCQAARADLLPLAGAAEELRRSEADDPSLQPSPALLDRVLGIARSEVRRGRRLPLDAPGAERTSAVTVSAQAVGTVIRRLGDATDEVQVRRVHLVPLTADDETTGGGSDETLLAAGTDRARTRMRVALRVSVSTRADIPAVAERLRQGVIAAVGREVGILVTSVDVTVEDLHD